MKQTILLSATLILFSFVSAAQDTLLLLNGKSLNVKVDALDPVEEYLTYQQKKGNRVKYYLISTTEIFSVAYKDSIKVITYGQDTTMGLEFNTAQMYSYIQGEQFAMTHYKSPWVTTGGVISGAAGGFFLRAYIGFLVPTAYCGAIGISKVHIKKQEEKYPELFKNEYFVSGYLDQAKHKKVKNSIWGGLAGMGVGLLAYSMVFLLK